eukprot:TRINITY_DN4041_c0_g1_i1.p1 TRINITY_DN4041_c0_g1~~TRINITY_DN4041_c0_g1_i1.p1  ORF type:complete len:258 (-),score=75.28 TRINITY_DN4041_c0_g1_i1:275-1006(-)
MSWQRITPAVRDLINQQMSLPGGQQMQYHVMHFPADQQPPTAMGDNRWTGMSASSATTASSASTTSTASYPPPTEYTSTHLSGVPDDYDEAKALEEALAMSVTQSDASTTTTVSKTTDSKTTSTAKTSTSTSKTTTTITTGSSSSSKATKAFTPIKKDFSDPDELRTRVISILTNDYATWKASVEELVAAIDVTVDTKAEKLHLIIYVRDATKVADDQSMEKLFKLPSSWSDFKFHYEICQSP